MLDLFTVKERLRGFWYEVKEEDNFSLNFCIEKVRNYIMNETNLPDVPKGLEHIAVDMAVGEFLFAKKTFEPSDLSNFDLDYAVKQVQIGDTNTVFAVGSGSLTDEQRLDNFITYLLTNGKSEFSAYRCIKW